MFDQWQVVCGSGQWIYADKLIGEFINVAKKFAKSIITTPVKVRYENVNQTILSLEQIK